MAQYTAIFTKPYEDGYENLPSQNTPITAETLNDKDDAIVNIETYLSGNDIPSDAEGLSYDNTDSGLTADNVQSAIDEIVTDIPTTAEDIGYDNTDSGLTANNVQGAVDELADEKIDKTGVDVKTNTTGQFNTVTGGLMESCVINIEPKQSGSGTPSPSNVRPITGHTAVEVWEHGKNRLDFNKLTTYSSWKTDIATYGDFPTSSYNRGYLLDVESGKTYTITFGINSTTFPQYLYIISGDGVATTRLCYFTTDTYNTNSYTFTAESGKIYYLRCGGMGTSAEFDTGFVAKTTNAQLELGSTATAYEPYQGQDITVNLGGTYYGGKLDVVSGVGSVSDGYVDLGSLNYTYDSANQRFYTDDLTNTNISYDVRRTPFICSCYQAITDGRPIADVPDGSVYNASYNKRIYIHDSRYTVLADLKTALSGQTLVYPLATPTTIQLTPQQINTLIGENHIDVPMTGQSLTSAVYRKVFAWDDVNDVVELRLPISAIGTDESNNDAASQAYSQGDYFYKNGIAKAKTSIAQGATFTLGTNYEIKTLAEILKALES